MDSTKDYVEREEFDREISRLEGWIKAVDGRVWLIVMAIVADAATHILR